MEQTFKDALDRALALTGRSLRSVAAEAGVSYDKLKNLRQSKSQTTNIDDGLKVIAVFGVTPSDFYDGNLAQADRATLPVAGRVGAGALVPLHDATDDGGLFRVIIPPQLRGLGANGQLAAVEVDGDSMAPMFQPGDLLFFSRATHEGVPAEAIGRPCIIEDSDGNAWVKLLRMGDEPGLYHLISLNFGAETLHNQRIIWAARVRLALPADMVDRA